jgi:hypothetical protein
MDHFCRTGRLRGGPTMTTLVPMTADAKAAMLADLVNAVLQTPGASGRGAREDAMLGRDAGEPWSGYLAKVRDSSYRVTATDFEAMQTAGVSEDAIFELTLAAAVGAGKRRLDAGLRALSGEA